MDTVNNGMEGKGGAERRPGILYPLMLIAAITVIVFSVAGIATMMGWLPSVQSKVEPAATPAAEPAPKATAPARPAASRPRVMSSAAAACGDCGVVESIQAVETKGQGSGLGAIGGAVVGGILGNQVGRGNGRTAATVVGAGAGAYAGHEIEQNVNKSVSYQVRVRMNDGSIRTFYDHAQPALAIGQKVRVTDQGVVAAG
jgi:outer membrane lipoprotein SlyB